MRLTIQDRKRVTAVVAARYQKAEKKQKAIILTEFIELTRYTRCYASYSRLFQKTTVTRR